MLISQLALLDTIPHLFFSSLNYKFNPLFLAVFPHSISITRCLYSAFYFCAIYSLYAKKERSIQIVPFCL